MKKIMYVITLMVPLCYIMGISAMADKVSKAIAEKKYTPVQLKDWYLKGKLLANTQGGITKADYEAYIHAFKSRPLPIFKPAQPVSSKSVPPKQAIKVSAVEKNMLIGKLSQAILQLFKVADPITNLEGSEVFVEEIMEKAAKKALRDYFVSVFGVEPPEEELE